MFDVGFSELIVIAIVVMPHGHKAPCRWTSCEAPRPVAAMTIRRRLSIRITIAITIRITSASNADEAALRPAYGLMAASLDRGTLPVG